MQWSYAMDEDTTPLTAEGEHLSAQGVQTQPTPLPQLQAPTQAFYAEKLAPHSFLSLSIVLSIVCFFAYLPVLFCTVPAIVVSAVVSL